MVPIEPLVGFADEHPVEAPRAGARLVAGDEQDRTACRVEGEGKPPFSIRRAEAHLLHVRMSRSVQRVHPRPSQQGSELLQQVSDGEDFVLDLSVQTVNSATNSSWKSTDQLIDDTTCSCRHMKSRPWLAFFSERTQLLPILHPPRCRRRRQIHRLAAGPGSGKSGHRVRVPQPRPNQGSAAMEERFGYRNSQSLDRRFSSHGQRLQQRRVGNDLHSALHAKRLIHPRHPPGH